MSYCHTRFPDFSSLYFHISGWKLVQSFYMKSYRSSSTFLTVDLLFYELLPFVQNSFSELFSVMLSHIWMKVGRKLPHEELQIKFNFCHGWPTFSRVIALCSKFVFRTFLCYFFTYMNESWKEAYVWRVTDQVPLVTVDLLLHDLLPFLKKNSFPHFSFFCMKSYTLSLKHQIIKKNLMDRVHVIMPPFEKGGAYCFAHVGRSICRYP